MLRRFVAACSAVLFATNAMGHEGHGVHGQGNTVVHYVLDPLHLPMLILVCLGALGLLAISHKYFTGVRRTKHF